MATKEYTERQKAKNAANVLERIVSTDDPVDALALELEARDEALAEVEGLRASKA